MTTSTWRIPDKLPAAAIFALLDRAPFGRLTTYAPPHGHHAGRCYVVPLQFMHRNGILYLITTSGRKVRNLRAAPEAVCFQLDLTEGAGWTSVCAWGTYRDVSDLSERMSILAASFTKYPDRTTRQAVSLIREVAPRAGRPLRGALSRPPVFGRVDLKSVGGRSWPGLLLSAGPDLVHPPLPREESRISRTHPVALDPAACRDVMASRPLARVGCYHPSRQRTYCVPLWFAIEDNDLWFYLPPGGTTLRDALWDHAPGVCAQVDNLDCSPEADPGQPWNSVLGEGSAEVFSLGTSERLEVTRQQALLRAIRARLQTFAIESVFVPPDPDTTALEGALIRLRMQHISGQATGADR